MARGAVPIDARGLVLGAGALMGLVEALMGAATWPEQEQVLLALNLQAVNLRDAVIDVHANAIRLIDGDGLPGDVSG